MEPSFQRAEGNGKLSLVRKLAEVMAAVERVPKSGRNDFHRYDYATEADIVAAVRLAMAERQVMMVPAVVDTKWGEVPRAKGGTDRLCTLTVRFTLHDGESGEQLAFDVIGEGQDAGDKASYKAMTGAVKYALLKLFLIPTGDDPEDDTGAGKGQGSQGQKNQGAPPPSGAQRPSQEAPKKTPATVTHFPPKQEQPPAPPPAPKPSAGADVPRINWGKPPLKGMPVKDATPEQLRKALNVAAANIAADPGRRWETGVRKTMGQLAERLTHEDLGTMLDTATAGATTLNGVERAAAKVMLSVLEPEADRRAKQAAPSGAPAKPAEPPIDDVPF